MTRLNQDNVALLLGVHALCAATGQLHVTVNEAVAVAAARWAGVTLNPTDPFVSLECIGLVRCDGNLPDGQQTFSLTRTGCLAAGMLSAQRRAL